VLADEAVASSRFKRRKPHYERIADHIVDTSLHTPEDCVEAVLDVLRG
jgi:shikimate kinase